MSVSSTDDGFSPLLTNVLGQEISHLPETEDPPFVPEDDQDEEVVIATTSSSTSVPELIGGFKKSTSVETINWKIPDENVVDGVLKSHCIAIDEDL